MSSNSKYVSQPRELTQHEELVQQAARHDRYPIADKSPQLIDGELVYDEYFDQAPIEMWVEKPVSKETERFIGAIAKELQKLARSLND